VSVRTPTASQQKLLKLLADHIHDPLSYRDIAESIGVKSPNTVSYHLRELEMKGLLKRNPSNPQDYQVLGEQEPGVIRLKLYGLAHCGRNGSLLDGNPIDKVPVASRFIPFSIDKAFLVKAKGDSMETDIHDGDLVLVKRQTHANTGQIIACVNRGECLIKQYGKGRPNVLSSLNKNYLPIVVADDFRIEGVVAGIVSRIMRN
jgi:repressor LexA